MAVSAKEDGQTNGSCVHYSSELSASFQIAYTVHQAGDGMEAEMVQEIYLDNNATTKPLAEVRAAVLDVLGDDFGNPSSANTRGERVRIQLQKARGAIAAILGVLTEQVVFCGSGTEASNLVLHSAASRTRDTKPRVVTTAIEHSSVLKFADHLERHGAEIVISACRYRWSP